MTEQRPLTARERNQARANGTLIDQPSLPKSTPEPDVQCTHRSWGAVGKIRCNCSNQPEVYECSTIASGYCTPRLPNQPGDGQIILADGRKLSPADSRFPTFLPMPLLAGEEPRSCDVVVCRTCPKRVEPPAHIAQLKRLGVRGTFDPDTGHCDVLHVLPIQTVRPDQVPIPNGQMECTVMAGRAPDLLLLVDATTCKLLVLYGSTANTKAIADVMGHYATALKIWVIGSEAGRKRDEIANVWYDLPDDLAAELLQHERAALRTAVSRILE